MFYYYFLPNTECSCYKCNEEKQFLMRKTPKNCKHPKTPIQSLLTAVVCKQVGRKIAVNEDEAIALFVISVQACHWQL